MKPIKDIDQHMLCTADPYRGVIERTIRNDKMIIYLPVGGEITISREKTYTVIRREGHSILRVYRYAEKTG